MKHANSKPLRPFYFLLVCTLIIMILGGIICSVYSANIGITIMFVLNAIAFITVIVKNESSLSAPVHCKCCGDTYSANYNFCPTCGTKQFLKQVNNDTAFDDIKADIEKDLMPEKEDIDLKKIEFEPTSNTIMEEPADLTDDLPQSEDILFNAKDFF